jgi:metal-responsive CopG/Arc/MetJ family transcriptional regulator
MKTAVSIPDDLFERAEQLARRTKKSRSQLFSDAVKEYVARHASENVTNAMDRVCGELGNRKD